MPRKPMSTRAGRVAFGAALAAVVSACTPVESDRLAFAPIGEALPGLSSDDLTRFDAGRDAFARPFTPEQGVGPRYNENACNACHTDPADGGTGEQLVVKATRFDPDRGCDPLAELGGENLRRLVTPALRAEGGEAVPIPSEATHTGRFTTPFLFGMGLIDAIPLGALRALEDPDDADADGISGRLGVDREGRPSRFGRKANVADLETFVDEAFRFEMGMTTERRPDERAAGAIPDVAASLDPVPEPEVDGGTFDAVTTFVRFLAPPAPRVPESTSEREAAARGEILFGSLGCEGCHVPELTAGPGAVAALSDRRIQLYSDLLLHDMGGAFSGPCTAGASPTEYRTEPLMGLRYRTVYLHDGRAGRVIDAILMHGGEAQAARDAFSALDRVTQEDLIRFLDTL